MLLLACLAACNEATTDSHITPIRLVTTGEGDSNLTRKVLTLAGHVTLQSEGKTNEPNELHIQDGTAAIDLRLPAPDTLLKVGDYVVAKGTVDRTEGELRLLVMSHQTQQGSDVVTEPVEIPDGDIELAMHDGLLVSVTGRVVRSSEDAEGKYLTLNRSGGPLVLRGFDDFSALTEVKVGDRLRARGVLFSRQGRDAGLIPYQVYLRSPEDLTLFSNTVPIGRWWWVPVLLLLLTGSWMVYRRKAARQMAIFRTSASTDTFFAGTVVPALMLDADLNIIAINRAASTLFATTPREIKRTSLLGHLSGLEPEETVNDITGRLNEGETVNFKAILDRVNGLALPLACHLNRIEGPHGICVAAILIDRSLEADETRLFEDFHRTVLEHVPVEVAVLTPRGEYVYVNSQVVKEKEVRVWLAGKTDVDYCKHLNLHPEVVLRRRTYRKQAVLEGKPVEFEEILAESGGSRERHFRRVYYPVANGKGEPYLIISFGIDTTDLWKVREEAKAALTKAHEAKEQEARYERLRVALLDNLNHEFRTPLTGIIGASQIVRMEAPASLGEFVDIIERNSNRLIQTVNTLLDLAGLQADNVRVTPRLLNVADEVAEVVGSLQPLASAKGLFLRMNTIRPEIVAYQDPDALHRVVHHIVDNAIKFTNTGGVLVELDGIADSAVLRVIDTGVGITKEHLPYLFDAFNQESAGKSRHFEGTGVGLAVTRKLLDLMNAHISVDSERDGGTTFTITIPLSVDGGGQMSQKQPRLLVLDDNTESHRIIEYMLGSYFHVHNVRTTEDALQEVNAQHYDLLLVDSHFTHRVCGDSLPEQVQGVPVVVMDAIQLPGTEAEYRASGYTGYLTKPLDRRNLFRTIGDILAGQTKANPQASEYIEITT